MCTRAIFNSDARPSPIRLRLASPALCRARAVWGDTGSQCSASRPLENHTDPHSSACWKACRPGCHCWPSMSNVELARRQQGYGRGRRMQIERDTVEFLSGVRAGQTIGSPIAMLIANRDWKNWQDVMDPGAARRRSGSAATRRDARASRPRRPDGDCSSTTATMRATSSSARRLARRPRASRRARSASGLLAELDVQIGSHLVHLGGIDATAPGSAA